MQTARVTMLDVLNKRAEAAPPAPTPEEARELWLGGMSFAKIRKRFRLGKAEVPALVKIAEGRASALKSAPMRMVGMVGRANGESEGLPKFARHDAHVAAVMAQGGFGAFTQRVTAMEPGIGLPMIWPGREVS